MDRIASAKLGSLLLLSAGIVASVSASQVLLQAKSDEAKPVPVIIGEIEDMDACLGFGTIAGEAVIRNGPGPHYAQVDTLASAHSVHLCSQNEDESWLGIVYAPADAETDCAVSSPVPEPKAYDGPCRSGWVERRWVNTAE